MKELWIIQTKIQHYRVPIFDRLSKNKYFKNFKVLGKTLEGKAVGGSERDYFIHLDLVKIINLFYWKGIIKLILKNKIDLVVMTASPRNISAWIIPLFRKFSKLETIGWSKINSDNLNKTFFYHYFLKKLFYSLYDKMIVYGEFSKNELLSLKYKKDNIYILNNTIDTSYITEKISEIRHNSDILQTKYKIHNKKIILFIGRLDNEKKPFDAINAFLKLKGKNKNTLLVIVGDGILNDKILNKLNKINISEILFVGKQEEFLDYAWINLASCLVVPGQVGLASHQAMALGTPVIIADEGGVDSENIINNKTGFRFPKGDIVTLSKKIELILKGNNEINNIIENAKNLIIKQKNIENFEKKFLSIIL